MRRTIIEIHHKRYGVCNPYPIGYKVARGSTVSSVSDTPYTVTVHAVVPTLVYTLSLYIYRVCDYVYDHEKVCVYPVLPGPF